MTTHELAPHHAAAIIRTLGAAIINAHGASADETAEGADSSAWGTKQRELLLRALIERLAVHAREHGNAALSVSDDGLARFARQAFDAGTTRSTGDRAPITKSVSKVVGGWLRRLGRKAKQNRVIASVPGEVRIGNELGKYRLRLCFDYPRRVVPGRRLLITASFEELDERSNPQPLPFRADARRAEVALPEKRQLRPADARHLEALFGTLRTFAESVHDPALQAYVDRGVSTFVPWSAPKILVAVFASLLALTTLTAAAEWVYHRLIPDVLAPRSSTRCSPTPAVLLTFPARADGVRVERSDGSVVPVRGSVAVDERPRVGQANHYIVRSTRTLLVPWVRSVRVAMPACSAVCPPPCDVSLSLDVRYVENRGLFDLTRDRTGLGDPPAVQPSATVKPRHVDEHLDFYIYRDCETCRRSIHVLGHLGIVDETDARVTVDYGDGTPPLSFMEDAAVPVIQSGAVPIDPSKPQLYVGRLRGDENRHTFSFFGIHQYAEEGSYVVTIKVEGRSAPKRPSQHVKTLRRRVRVGLIASIEMYESFHLPASSTE